MIILADIAKLRNKKAVVDFISKNYGGDPHRFVAAYNSTVNELLRKDINQVKILAEKAGIVFKFLPDEFHPLIHAIRGRYCHWSGQYIKALNNYDKALTLYKVRRNSAAVARLYRGMIEAYMYLGRYREAVTTGKKSLSYFKRKGLLNDAAQVMTNIGNVYHRMDNNRMALKYYNQAREIFAKDGGIPLAIVEYNRANIHANLNQLKIARALYQNSATLYKKTGLKIAEAQAIYSIAYLYFLEDEFTKAINVFERVYDDFKTLGDEKTAAITQLDLIEINIHLSQFGTAIMMGGKLVKELSRLGMKYEKAKTHYFMGLAYLKLGDLKPASKELNTAKNLFKQENNNLWLGMIYTIRSKLNLGNRRFKAAVDASRGAIDYFRKSCDERRRLDAEISLAEAILESGDTGKVLKLCKTISRKKLLNYQYHNLYSLSGYACFRRGDFKMALEYFRKAVEIVERMLMGLYPDEIRFFFFAEKYDCYLMVIESLLKLQKVDDAFSANLKALQLINHKRIGSEKMNSKIPAELIENRNKLRAALKKATLAPETSGGSLRGLSTFVDIEQKLWLNERKIRSFQYPEKLKQNTAETESYGVYTKIKKGRTVVSFFSARDSIGAFVADNTETRYCQFDIKADELKLVLRKLHFLFEKAVYSLRGDAVTKEAIESNLRYIYGKLIEPLLPGINSRKLILLVDGMFSQIPFIALPDDEGRTLCNSFDLRLIVDYDDISEKRLSSNSFLKRSNAVFAVSSDMLPSVSIEGRYIREKFPSCRFYGDHSATTVNLHKELTETNGFLHIAAHASRSSENPLFSRILMDDGPFFPFDLFGRGIKAKLVTLSGCQTAAPGLYYGNSFSLAKAFYQAGGEHVLASLWPISDKLSMLFMKEFYSVLYKSDNIFDAYYKAVDKLRGITDNPAFWGAFVLIGD